MEPSAIFCASSAGSPTVPSASVVVVVELEVDEAVLEVVVVDDVAVAAEVVVLLVSEDREHPAMSSANARIATVEGLVPARTVPRYVISSTVGPARLSRSPAVIER